MLIKVRYSVREVLLWTRFEIVALLGYAALVAVLYRVVGLRFLHLPWAPVAVVGTAVAFIVGFQNNAAYGRIWEARKIWGGIVNASRSWGMHVQECVSSHHATEAVDEAELTEHRRTLIHRHIAWLTSLRHAMRQTKPWETFDQCPANRAWSASLYIPEREASAEEEIGDLVSEAERKAALSRSNPAAAFLFEQSRHLSQLKDRGLIWEFSYLQMLKSLEGLFELQGKSERIKNFPYPRQYSTIGHQFVRLFILLIPFAALPQFAAIGASLASWWQPADSLFVWLAVPFSALISWMFHVMERIGSAGENPFEGTANDVPISTIARAIEIDLRELLGENGDTVPGPLKSLREVQM